MARFFSRPYIDGTDDVHIQDGDHTYVDNEKLLQVITGAWSSEDGHYAIKLDSDYRITLSLDGEPLLDDHIQFGKLLYSCYHTGGFVGEEPLKPNERYVKAENGELILTSDQQSSFAAQVDSFKATADAFSRSIMDIPVTTDSLWPGSALERGSSVSNVTTNNNPVEISFGDTTITCVSEKSVEAHQKISRDMLNEIARQFRKP